MKFPITEITKFLNSYAELLTIEIDSNINDTDLKKEYKTELKN